MSSPLAAPLDAYPEASEETVPELPRISSDSSRPPDLELSRNSNSRTPPPQLGRRSHSKRSIHSRSQSHNKIPVRLSSSANTVKPHLNRSKSTDGISRTNRPGIKRNNRSYTKVSGLHPLTKTLLNSSLNRALGALQPLTKTMSNNSLKQHALRKTTLNGSTKGAPHLAHTHLDQSIKSNKSSGSLRGMNGGSSTSVMNTAAGGIKTSSKRGRAILKLNEDAADNDYEDLSEDSEAENEKLEAISNSELQRQFQPTEDTRDSLQGEDRVSEDRSDVPTTVENPKETQREAGLVGHLTQKLNQLEGDQELKPTTSKTSFISSNSSAEDLESKNLYGGSMLLSQSTGLTRKINTGADPIGYGSEESDLMKNQPESLSGIVFNTRNDEQRRKDLEQTKPAAPGGSSYRPDQTIFSNLQRTDAKFVSDMKLNTSKDGDNYTQAKMLSEATNNSKDFSHFLNTNSAGSHSQRNHDTRTQQRLWLQRENSLMDVAPSLDTGNFSNLSLNKLMFAHNYNGSTTNVRDTSGARNTNPSWYQGQDSASSRESSAASPGESSSSVTNLLYLVQSGQHNSIQSRVEFERLNREYVNVRRHLNPVAESLSRVETFFNASRGLDVQKKQNKKAHVTQNRNANSFKEFAPHWEEKQEEISSTIGRLWQGALISSSSSSVSLQLYKQEQQNQQQHSLAQLANTNASTAMQTQQLYHQQLQHQQQEQQQLRAYRHNISTTPNRAMAPTTRAVKMAAQAAAAATPQGQK